MFGLLAAFGPTILRSPSPTDTPAPTEALVLDRVVARGATASQPAELDIRVRNTSIEVAFIQEVVLNVTEYLPDAALTTVNDLTPESQVLRALQGLQLGCAAAVRYDPTAVYDCELEPSGTGAPPEFSVPSSSPNAPGTFSPLVFPVAQRVDPAGPEAVDRFLVRVRAPAGRLTFTVRLAYNEEGLMTNESRAITMVVDD
jgi:hypothetical protein